MNPTTAWIDGQTVPVADAAFAADDFLVTSAAAVCETLRTFRHEPFLLDEHLDRLEASATAVRVPLRMPPAEIGPVVRDLVAANSDQIDAADDFVVSIVASPGRGRTLG
ncbi:MAG: aminotransferase class IV, partial [Planctomycetota bacterium]